MSNHESDFWVEVKSGKKQASKHAHDMYELWISVMRKEAKKFGYEIDSSNHERVQ